MGIRFKGTRPLSTNIDFEINRYQGANDYFVFVGMSGVHTIGTGRKFNRLVWINYYKSGSNPLNLSGELLTRVRQIFGLSNSQYLDYDVHYPIDGSKTIPFDYDETTQSVGQMIKFDYARKLLNPELLVDDDFPLIITEDTANLFTNFAPTGQTITQPEMKNPDTNLTYCLFKDINLVEEGQEYPYPYELMLGEIDNVTYGFGDVADTYGTGSTYRANARFMLEYILQGVNSWDDLTKKFYQTPRGSEIIYAVDANLNNGVASVSLTMSDKWQGANSYEEQTTKNVYTSYEGVTLDRQYVGITGSGTSYEIRAKCVNGSGNVVRDIILDTLDSPQFPLTVEMDNINLKFITGLIQGEYNIYLYLNSYQTEFSLAVQGTKLVQLRNQTLNGTTESDTSIYFGVNIKLDNTPIEPPRVNANNSGIKFTETLTIKYTLDKKKPLTPIPDSPLPSLTGFAKVFKLVSGDVVNFNSWLWGVNDLDPDTFFNIEKLKKINQNPYDNIMFLKVCPFNLESGTSLPITLGNLTYTDTEYPKVNTYSKIKIGDIKLTRYYSDYRDFSPFTNFRLFLPFVGFIELDPKNMYGENCTLNIIINSDTFIAIYDLRRDSDNMVVGQWECNVGMDFPLTSSNLSQNVTSAMGSIFETASRTLSGDLTGGIDSLMESLDASTQGLEIKHNTPSANTSFAVSRWAYVEITYMDYEEPEVYAHTHGYPCNKALRLGNCKGYTQVTNVDLSGIRATANELEMIRQLLANGVYL